MTNKFIFAFPEQLVIPYPEPASFAMTYLIFGALFFLASRLWPFKPVKNHGIIDYVVMLVMDLVAWPALIVLEIYFMEKKLREENLFEEVIKEMEGQ